MHPDVVRCSGSLEGKCFPCLIIELSQLKWKMCDISWDSTQKNEITAAAVCYLSALDWQHVMVRETGYCKAGPKNEMETRWDLKMSWRQMAVSCWISPWNRISAGSRCSPPFKKDCYISFNCVVLFDANVSLYFCDWMLWFSNQNPTPDIVVVWRTVILSAHRDWIIEVWPLALCVFSNIKHIRSGRIALILSQVL